MVDGFSAARDLFQENYKAYHQLSTTPVWGHASGNEGISIQPANGFPVLNPVKADSSPEEMLILQQVRWNTADRAGIQTEHRGELEDWYNAAE